MATRRPSPRRRARVLHHHVDRPGGRLARVSRRLARRVDSVDLTVALFAVNKILQATAFFGFWHVAANDPDAIRTDDGDVRPRALSRLALGLPLVLAGQVLNAATYAAIGRDGVYYGCRFGRPVPWHTGFPFTVVSHPQYAGATMTAWGTCALLANRTVVRRGWFGIAAAQSAYYLYMSLVEANVAPKC